MVTDVWVRRKLHPWYLRAWQRMKCALVGHVWTIAGKSHSFTCVDCGKRLRKWRT